MKKYLSHRLALVMGLLHVFFLVLAAYFVYEILMKDLSIWFLIIYILSVGLFDFLVYNYLLKPYWKIMKTLRRFVAGYTIDDVFAIKYSLNPEMDRVLMQLYDYLDTDKVLEANKNQAHFLALQNQINPHFLYNALEGIRGEAIAANQTNISDMTEALSTFFRYTISNIDHMVTLHEELVSIGHYFFIQKYRFENRFSLETIFTAGAEDLSEEVYMPKLVLQPIVENAIIHGVEPKTGQGKIVIKVEQTEKWLIITVSDNGAGIGQEKLAEINKKLKKRTFDYFKEETKGGIALFNVNNRLKLIYGEEYGITLYSTEGVGTDAEILLPVVNNPQFFKGGNQSE